MTMPAKRHVERLDETANVIGPAAVVQCPHCHGWHFVGTSVCPGCRRPLPPARIPSTVPPDQEADGLTTLFAGCGLLAVIMLLTFSGLMVVVAVTIGMLH